MNIDPRGLTVKEWCDYMVDELTSYGPAPTLLDEGQWRAWGETVLLLPGISRFTPPEPRLFDDWQDWAMRFNQAVYL